MQEPEQEFSSGEDPVTADIPLDDPATIPPDEGDAGDTGPDDDPGHHRQTPPPTPLGTQHRIRARDLAIQAAALALRNRDVVHYTEGGQRWEGIDKHLKAWAGHFPRHADCSAFATWCLWNGLDHYGYPDTINGARWRMGYTGTQLEHGTRITSEHDILRGDLAIYGSGFPGKHVAICIGGGMVISHGSEPGPFKLPLHYRADLMEVRRYI